MWARCSGELHSCSRLFDKLRDHDSQVKLSNSTLLCAAHLPTLRYFHVTLPLYCLCRERCQDFRTHNQRVRSIPYYILSASHTNRIVSARVRPTADALERAALTTQADTAAGAVPSLGAVGVGRFRGTKFQIGVGGRSGHGGGGKKKGHVNAGDLHLGDVLTQGCWRYWRC